MNWPNINKQNNKWWILAALSACLAMLNLNTTSVAVILPQLFHDFGMNQVMQQWVVNAYLLPLGVLMIIGGRISDMIGHKQAFLIGLSGFLLSSLFCGLALDAYTLLASRAIQGAFAAVLMPNTAVIVLNAFPKNEKATAIGIYAGSAAVFLALGPLLGGICTQFLSWRYVFWLNIPVGLLSAIIACWTVPYEKKALNLGRIDWVGFCLLVCSSTTLLVALMQGVNWGWSSAIIVWFFVVGFLTGAIFIVYELNATHPLVNFYALRDNNYVATTIIVSFVEMGLTSRIFWAIFFQIGFDCSPLIAGLMIIPSTASNMVFTPIAGRLIDRYGPRLPTAIGLSCIIAGLLWICLFSFRLEPILIIIGTIVTGIGLAMTGNMSAVALANIPEDNKSVAYATYQQARQLAGTFGVAIIGALITNLYNRYYCNLMVVRHMPEISPIHIDNIKQLANSISASVAGVPQDMLASIHELAVLAYAKAFGCSLIPLSICVGLGLYLCLTKLGIVNEPASASVRNPIEQAIMDGASSFGPTHEESSSAIE